MTLRNQIKMLRRSSDRVEIGNIYARDSLGVEIPITNAFDSPSFEDLNPRLKKLLYDSEVLEVRRGTFLWNFVIDLHYVLCINLVDKEIV